MPGLNLTRDEAARRSQLVSDVSYRIHLDLTGVTDGVETFGSVTELSFSASPGESTFLDFDAAEVTELTLNDEPVDTAAFDGHRIELTGLAEQNELRIVGRCNYSRTGEGLHRTVDPSDGRTYLYTQFEVPYARNVYATFEQPDLKATFEFEVIAPADWQVISNTPAAAPEPVDTGADGAGAASGQAYATFVFPQTLTMSTYITALCAGPYHRVDDSYTGEFGTYPLSILVRQSLADHLDADELFEITKQGFAWFEKNFRFGYPFGKYDQVFVPEYNMGAMENAGCVTFRDEYVFRSRTTAAEYESRANTVLHEMAHMWFGDLVTMRWWDDLWLNESFAEWASHWCSANATKYTDSWTTFANQRKGWAYRADQMPSTHPIAADMVDLIAVAANFDGITYAKGASTLRQLVAFVGEDSFVEAVANYFVKHQYGNTTLTDLLTELTAASGRELDEWARLWLQTSGVNTLRADFEVAEDGTYASFAVVQTASEQHPTLRPHRIAIGRYDRGGDGTITRTERVELDIDGERTEVSELVGKPQPDLLLLNDDDLTYAKIRLDDRSRDTLVTSIGNIVDSLPRALCTGAAWDMTRDGEMPASQYVPLVLGLVQNETDMTAVRTLLGHVGLATERYASVEHRDQLRIETERTLGQLLLQSEPGSDHQLAFARAYAGATFSDDGARRLAGWLTGENVPPGLTIDPDLRWAIVTSLARLGELDEAAIDAEAERDRTTTGQGRAAGARAARPTAEAKAEAWRRAVTEATETANETQFRIAFAFHQPGQDELVAPYAEKYLEAAPGLFDRLGQALADNVLTLMGPRTPDRATLDRLHEWLDTAGDDVDHMTRRLVSEVADDMARALAARACDEAS